MHRVAETDLPDQHAQGIRENRRRADCVNYTIDLFSTLWRHFGALRF